MSALSKPHTQYDFIVLEGRDVAIEMLFNIIDNDDFTFSKYNKHNSYNKQDIFVINEVSLYDDVQHHLVETLLENGFKVVIDAMCELHCELGYKLWQKFGTSVMIMVNGTTTQFIECSAINLVPNFFWFSEAVNNKVRGLDQYTPRRNISKLFLMPMRRNKADRGYMYNAMHKYNDNALISFVAEGIELPMTHTSSNMLVTNWDDRNFNSDWYDTTYFSIVAETAVSKSADEIALDRLDNYDSYNVVFLTEKTFKPISFEHPFMILGLCGSLQRLQDLGFATFSTLFDESYDTVRSGKDRVTMIDESIQSFDLAEYHSPIVQEALLHNRAHFYNTSLIDKMINDEVIAPLEAFAELVI